MTEPGVVGGPIVGEDGFARCPWGDAPADLRGYHDREWGRPVHDDAGLFERLTLEAFQSGLSWRVVLRKRQRLREVFADFDARTVAVYDETDVARLLTDPGIVRNRAKIEATVANARAVLALEEPVGQLIWRFAPDPRPPRPETVADVPATTLESAELARELRCHGFRFVGPTTAYALMQATGMVDDHLAGCAAPGAHGWSRADAPGGAA